MNLEELKKKFRHRAEIDVKDISIAIKAVPFLVKEVIRLEEQVAHRDRIIEKLGKKVRSQPLLETRSQKDQFSWHIKIYEDLNVIAITFAGEPNPAGARMCSNAIMHMSKNLDPGFSLISDFTKLNSDAVSKRILFYFKKVQYFFWKMEVQFVVSIVEDEKNKNISSFLDLPVRSKNKNFKILKVKSVKEGLNVIHNMGKYIKG